MKIRERKTALAFFFFLLFFGVQIYSPSEYLLRDINIDIDNRFAWTMFDGQLPFGVHLHIVDDPTYIQVDRASNASNTKRNFNRWRLLTCSRMELMGYTDYDLRPRAHELPDYISPYIGENNMCPEKGF